MVIYRKIQITVVSFIGFGMIFLFFAIFPMLREIKNNSQVLFDQRKIALDREVQKKSLEDFKLFSMVSGKNLKKIDSLFVDSDLPLEFIQSLEGIAAKNNLQIEIWPASKISSDDSGWSFLSFQVSLKGSFADFARFLEKTENSPYLAEIQSLNISAFKDGARNIEADLLIKISVK